MTPEVAEYVRTARVAVHEVGPRGTLKLGSALRMAQETSEQHLDHMGVGYETMLKKSGFVFFLISNRVRIFSLPKRSDEVVIKTHPRGRHGVQFYRDFQFFSKDGALLLEVMQSTVIADLQTRKIQRPQAVSLFGFSPDTLIDSKEKMERIVLPDSMDALGERRAFHSDLDMNGHMNNAVYGDVVSDFLPADLREKVRRVQINYLNETAEGDALGVYGAYIDEKYILRGDNHKGVSFTALVYGSE